MSKEIKTPAKPIFLIGIPNETIEYDHELGDFQRDLQKYLHEDYYTIVFTHGRGEMEFECVYESKFDAVKFAELKNLVTKLCNQKRK